MHCYLQLKLCGIQQTVELVTLDGQTALTVWRWHINGNRGWPGLPHAESVWGSLTDRLKAF